MTTWVTMLGVGDLSKWPKVQYLKQRVKARATVKAALAAETKPAA